MRIGEKKKKKEETTVTEYNGSPIEWPQKTDFYSETVRDNMLVLSHLYQLQSCLKRRKFAIKFSRRPTKVTAEDTTSSSLDKQIITFQIPDLECGVCVASHDELAIACNADVDNLR